MNVRRARLIAAAVAVLILVAGVGYAVTRDAQYESSASLLLAPTEGTDEGTVTGLLESFQRSGTSGTFVELIASRDTLRQADVGSVDVSVRAVPDARTITVTAQGAEDAVQPALERVIEASQERQSELGDVWRLQVLGTPSRPATAGISTPTVLIGTAFLALLGAALAFVVFGRYRLVPVTGDPAVLASGGAGGSAPAQVGSSPAAALPRSAEPHVHLDLESFRFVRASPTTVLLQVSGYWRAERDRELARATLLLHDGRRMHPLAPLGTNDGALPEAGPDTPLWRGSYAAPVEIFDRCERIALRAGPGVVVGLPNPMEQSLLGGTGNGNGSEQADEPVSEPDVADAH